MKLAVAILVICVATIAKAESPAMRELSGRVLARDTNIPLEGAIVYVAGSGGYHVLTTNNAGQYRVSLRAGTYNLVFAYGKSRSHASVTLNDHPQTVDGKVATTLGNEVIVIEEKLAPPVPPKPARPSIKAPAYSDRAILSDAWTKAWLLLDVSETGKVTRVKWLKRPGYDLEKIAMKEVFGLTFEPARDRTGKPMRAWVVWDIEWPSHHWMIQFVGIATRKMPMVGFPPRPQSHYVPCRGSGPMLLGSLHPTYKDCSQPDLKKAVTEPWIDR
jgi:hypothetical protein